MSIKMLEEEEIENAYDVRQMESGVSIYNFIHMPCAAQCGNYELIHKQLSLVIADLNFSVRRFAFCRVGGTLRFPAQTAININYVLNYCSLFDKYVYKYDQKVGTKLCT